MEYHQIVLIHRIAVSLFLLHYLIKGYLLLTDKKDNLAGYTAKTKIAEMILSVLFLGTGIFLVLKGPALTTLQIAKLVCVFAAIPIAIIGFKRGKKALAALALVLLFAAYGLAEMNHAAEHRVKAVSGPANTDPIAAGKEVYSAQCSRCHGDGGDANIAGAKNLKLTQLSDTEIKNVIQNGRPGTQMEGFKGMSDEQLDGLVAYIKTLKQ